MSQFLLLPQTLESRNQASIVPSSGDQSWVTSCSLSRLCCPSNSSQGTGSSFIRSLQAQTGFTAFPSHPAA